MINRSQIAVRILATFLCCGMLFPSGHSVTGDDESEALLKYKEPIDVSVDRALEYLKGQQAVNGSFPGQYGQTTAMAALAGMAFLSKGYTPGLGPYGENINRSIDFVLDNEKIKDGKRTGYLLHSAQGKMYAHCISTLFLSEVSGMVDPVRQEKIDDILPRALALILTAQEVSKEVRFQGGWRYEPHSRDADLSLTGWAVMALRSSRLNGAAIPNDAIGKAVDFILRCQPNNSRGERGFSYQPGQGGKPAMTGVGILCLMLCGRHNDPKMVQLLTNAGDFLEQQDVNRIWGGSHFFYAIYYCSQANFQLGGKYWDTWAVGMYENALQHQQPNGSWGDPYKSAMTVLALTVSYRQLPVYQR